MFENIRVRPLHTCTSGSDLNLKASLMIFCRDSSHSSISWWRGSGWKTLRPMRALRWLLNSTLKSSAEWTALHIRYDLEYTRILTHSRFGWLINCSSDWLRHWWMRCTGGSWLNMSVPLWGGGSSVHHSKWGREWHSVCRMRPNSWRLFLKIWSVPLSLIKIMPYIILNNFQIR